MAGKLANNVIRNVFGSSQHGHLLDPVRPGDSSTVGGLVQTCVGWGSCVHCMRGVGGLVMCTCGWVGRAGWVHEVQLNRRGCEWRVGLATLGTAAAQLHGAASWMC